jgi:hypothetical protein
MLARRDDVDSSGGEAPQSMRRGHSSLLQSGQEPMDIDGCDDVQSPVIVPQEDTVQHQPPDDTSSPVEYFFKRICQSTFERG